MKGVYKDNNTYRTFIEVNGKRICGGSYLTEKEAAVVYDKMSIYYGREPVNFPKKLKEYKKSPFDPNKALTSRAGNKFRGVHWNKKRRRWIACIKVNGKYTFLGYYISAETAAEARDKYAIKYLGDKAKLNFP